MHCTIVVRQRFNLISLSFCQINKVINSHRDKKNQKNDIRERKKPDGVSY